MSFNWTWAVGNCAPNTSWTHFLAQARSRRIVWQLDGSAYATFSVDGRSAEAAAVLELQTDLACWRDGELLFRGRIGSENDELSENTHTTTFYAMDYRGMLEFRRLGPGGREFETPLDKAAAAWALISESQALPGGNWGITQGSGSVSGSNIIATFNAGKPIKEALTELGQDHDFDWEVSPLMAFNCWHGGRGISNGVIMDFGGSVLRAHRSINPTDFANAFIETGTQSLVSYRAATVDVSTDPRGLWEGSESKTGFADQDALDARAERNLALKKELRAVLRVMLMPGFWQGADHMWLGDEVQVHLHSGRMNIDAPYRVSEIAADPGSGPNEETIDVILIPVEA